MKLVISCDHAGFPLKEDVRANLVDNGHEVVDLGAYKLEHEDDYSDYAEKLGEAIVAAWRRGEFSSVAPESACAWQLTKLPGFGPGFVTTRTQRTKASNMMT